MDNQFNRREKRTRAKLKAVLKRPRLVVFRSNKYIYAQVVDDVDNVTIAFASSKEIGKIGKLGKDTFDLAREVGIKVAERSISKKVKEVAFDKGGYKYTGKVKALAEGARKGGLIF